MASSSAKTSLGSSRPPATTRAAINRRSASTFLRFAFFTLPFAAGRRELVSGCFSADTMSSSCFPGGRGGGGSREAKMRGTARRLSSQEVACAWTGRWIQSPRADSHGLGLGSWCVRRCVAARCNCEELGTPADRRELLLVNCQPGANVFTLAALHRNLRCAQLKMLDYDWACLLDWKEYKITLEGT